jgi:general secretion pathway protein C
MNATLRHASAGPAVSRWGVRLAALVVWATLACSVAYWVLQWPHLDAPRDGALSDTPVASDELSTSVPTPAVMARALGGAGGTDRAATPLLSTRLSLQGVVRAGTREGAALIAVDGKSPRAVRVGAEVEPGLYLLALEPRRASLGPEPNGPESLTLELPRPKLP